MPKGFSYAYQIKRQASDFSSILRAITENFGAIARHINGYGVNKEEDGVSVSIETLVANNITLGGDITHAAGPEYIHAYQTGTQAINATTWTRITLDGQLGSSNANLALDGANDEIDVTQAGVYLVVGTVEFNAVEDGYLRVLVAGAEVQRASFDNKQTAAIVALIPVAVSAAQAVALEAWTTTASNTTSGSTSTFLKAARLFGV